jgi:hypothetical protein
MISRRGAGVAENFIFYVVLIPNTFATFAPWRVILCFYLSQRRKGRQENLCLFCSYPKHLCVLCASARLYLFLSRRSAGVAENFIFYVVLIPNTFATFAPW